MFPGMFACTSSSRLTHLSYVQLLHTSGRTVVNSNLKVISCMPLIGCHRNINRCRASSTLCFSWHTALPHMLSLYHGNLSVGCVFGRTARTQKL